MRFTIGNIAGGCLFFQTFEFCFALQRYWNNTPAWVFSCKSAAYFQNTFSQEHLWVAASDMFDQRIEFS